MPVGKTQNLLILVLNARQVLRYKSSELILRSPWPEQDGLILALVLITRTHYGGSMQMIKKKGQLAFVRGAKLRITELEVSALV
jgi:hypothetical protein